MYGSIPGAPAEVRVLPGGSGRYKVRPDSAGMSSRGEWMGGTMCDENSIVWKEFMSEQLNSLQR